MSNEKGLVPILAEHTVKPGETLSGIAYEYYRSGTREWWGAIYETNRDVIGDNASLIRPGMVLTIPQLQPPKPESRIIAEHTVKPNETLSHLALWYYGSAARDLWMLIYDANRETIGDSPRLIRPNQILKIPDVTDHSWRMKSDQPMRLTFKNETNLYLNIFWLDYDGKEVLRTTLSPNESSQHSTFVTHTWVVRDSDRGREILSTIATRQRNTIEVTEEGITSGPEVIPFPLVITNYTPFSVNLLHVAADGTETPHNTLAPGEAASHESFVNAVWRAREVNSGESVGLFIVTADYRREYAVNVTEFEGHGAATVEFRNESLLTLEVYWLYRGQAYLRHTLEPQASVIQSTFETHDWVVRDARSDFLVRKIRAGAARTVCEIHNRELRAQGINQQIASLFVQNSSNLVVDLYHVDSLGARTQIADALELDAEYIYPPSEALVADDLDEPRADLTPINAGDVLCVVERSTQKELAYYILGEDAEQSIDFAPKSFRITELSTVEFVNDTRLVLDLLWINYEGQETPMRRLVPGEHATFPTHVGNYWLLRDTDSGQLIDLIFTETRSQILQAQASELRGLHQRRPTSLYITNPTSLYLEVSVTDEAGSEHSIYNADGQQRLLLGPNDDFILNSFATHIVNIYEPIANVLIDQTVLSDQVADEYEISKNVYDLPRHTRLTIRNETGLKLILQQYSAGADGQEEIPLVDTLLPFSRKTYEQVPVSSFWIASDSLSQQMVGYAIASDQEQVVSINSDGMRSRESGAAINVNFENNTSFNVDIYWLNYDSEDELQGSLAPGETLPVDTFATHVFRMIEHKTGQEIDIYIPEFGVSQTNFVIEDMLVLRQERPNGELWPGEVALYSGEDFGGEVWILRNSFGDFTEIGGLVNNVRSLKVGPQTGVTLHHSEDYVGQAEDFYVDSPTLMGTDLLTDAGPRVGAVQVYRIVPSAATQFRAKTGLRKNYRQEADGTTRPYSSYRSVLSFPPEVQVVDVWATDPVTIEVNGQRHAIDNSHSARLKTNGVNKMVINIEATKIGTPVLKLRTNMMGYVERVLVFPDAEVHQKFSGMVEGAIWRDRATLGVDPGAREDKVNSLERAISNLSGAVAYVDKPEKTTESQQVTGDGMQYKRWMVDYGNPASQRTASFRSLSRQEARDLTANAEWIGPSNAQWFWDDIANAFEDAAEAIYSEIVEPFVDHVIVPIGEGVLNLLSEAAEFGEDAVRIVRELGEEGLELVKRIGEDGLRAIGHLGQEAFNAVLKLGQGAVDVLAKVGTTMFESLVDFGQAGIDLLAKIGQQGLEALEKIGTATLNALISATGAVGQTLAKLGEDIVAGIGKAVVMTVEFAGKAVKFVLNTAKQIGDFVAKVWEQIKVGFEKLLEWLGTFFNWGDYLDTHDVMLDVLNASLDGMGDMAQQAKPFILNMIDSIGNKADQSFDAFSTLIGAEELPRGSSSEPDQPDGMDELDWLVSTLFGGGGDDDSDDGDIGNLFPGHESRLTDAIERVQTAIDNESPDVLGELERAADYLGEAIKDLERAPALLAGFLIEIMRSLSHATFAVLKTVISALIDMVGTLLAAFKDFMNAPLDIPIISAFYELITQGRTLTLGSLVSLLISIPLTLFSKLFYGRKPFAIGVSFAQESTIMSDDDLIDWGLAFYIIRFVQSITEPIEIMTYGSRPEGKWSRRSLGGLQGVNGLLTIAAFSCKTRILLATYPLPSGGSFNDLIVLNPDMQDDWELNALYWNQVYYLTDIIANILYLPPKLGVAFVAWRNDWDLDKRDKYKKGVNSLKVLTGIARFIMNIIWAVEESEMVKTAKRDWNGRSDADLLTRGMDKHENFGFYSEPNITDDDIIDAERTRYQQLCDTGESDLLSLASARATGALPAIATFGKLTKNPKARLVSSLLTFVGFYANGSLMLVYANSYQAAHQG